MARQWTLHAFDLLEVAGQSVRQRGYPDCFTGLLRLLDATSAIRPVITEVASFYLLGNWAGLRVATEPVASLVRWNQSVAPITAITSPRALEPGQGSQSLESTLQAKTASFAGCGKSCGIRILQAHQTLKDF